MTSSTSTSASAASTSTSSSPSAGPNDDDDDDAADVLEDAAVVGEKTLDVDGVAVGHAGASARSTLPR